MTMTTPQNKSRITTTTTAQAASSSNGDKDGQKYISITMERGEVTWKGKMIIVIRKGRGGASGGLFEQWRMQ